MSKFHRGRAWPLGSAITKKGVNFSVAAPSVDSLELLIFESPNDKNPSETITLGSQNRSGDYWHIEVEGLSAGCCYCYRVKNTNVINATNPSSKYCLIDPCARAIDGWDIYKRSSNEETFLKSVVCERDKFDFEAHPRPNHSWEKTIIYELHVGGFTQNKESGVEANKKGTFIGLIDKIPYLKDLGVTSIELLPVFAFDIFDAPQGVNNYWGYSPINWFTPHPNYICKANSLGPREQFRQFVAACHDADLEVLLDVVYNHTTEGNEEGPTISWKGFDESIYYHKDNKNSYLDVTGCGNTIAANNPIVRNLILESMKCWSNELGVDGFRFDLGISLSRGDNLKPLDKPPLFEEIESDPYLSDLKLISEPWDCGGLYRLADFPAKRFSTWNGRFRDDIRRFWKGDKNCTWELKDRLMGSPELYKKTKASPKSSVNFITAHDGFTLLDLVSFNSKHNYANGENNRDGDNHNNSWNHGIEGPSTLKELEILRKKQQRNLFSSLLLSPGVPMLLMGDEVGRSQGGNNNTWCQNNQLGWMIWSNMDCDKDLKKFVKKLLNLRKKFPELFTPCNFFNDQSSLGNNTLWVEWHGIKLSNPDWSSWSHTISYSINMGKQGSVAWLGLNAYNQPITFELPKPVSKWAKALDTSVLTNQDFSKEIDLNQENISLENRSMVLMLANEYSKRIMS